MQKYVLVTSSTRGIGKEIGKSFLVHGYYVFFNYAHNDEDAHKLENEIQQYKGNYSIIKADMSDFNGIDIIYKHITRLDCLILNTGITNRKSFSEISVDDWNKVINTNLTIPFFLVQTLSPLINNNGRIVFIGALMGILPHAISISYGVSKAGFHMLAQSFVKVFANRNITINTVAPGFIDTPWQDNKTPEHRERIENKIALNRFGKPEEVAKVCISIVENDYINGAVINVDGGYDMGE